MPFTQQGSILEYDMQKNKVSMGDADRTAKLSLDDNGTGR